MMPRLPQTMNNNPNMGQQQQQQQPGSYNMQRQAGHQIAQVSVSNIHNMQQHQMDTQQRTIIQPAMRIMTPQPRHQQQQQPQQVQQQIHQLPQPMAPPQQQQQQQPQQSQQQQPQQQQHANSNRQNSQMGEQPKDLEPMIRAKAILPSLRESLVNLMQVASQNFSTNLAVDEGKKSIDVNSNPRLEKCIEHFYGLSDQLDLNLRLVLEQNLQVINNHTLPPQFQNINLKADCNSTETYATCQAIIDQQRTYSRELHETFANYCKKVEEKKAQRLNQSAMHQ